MLTDPNWYCAIEYREPKHSSVRATINNNNKYANYLFFSLLINLDQCLTNDTSIEMMQLYLSVKDNIEKWLINEVKKEINLSAHMFMEKEWTRNECSLLLMDIFDTIHWTHSIDY